NRKAYQGTQLAGKALGVVGMGRIGKAVAKRALGLQMHVIGYDPFLSEAGVEGAIEMAKDLADLCTRADYITVHTPKSDKTLGMIGPEQFAVMKPTVRLINAARGGIIDPQALLEALEAGKVAGAALDVYTSEPPETDSEKKLIQHPKVLAVPHLGASTEEAQEQVALEAAQQLVAALSGAAVRNALNAPGFDGALPPQLVPYTELAGRIGRILTAVTAGAVSKVQVTYRGAISELNTTPITTYLLVGLLGPHMDEPVNVINAPLLARQRGIEIEQISTERVKNFANVMGVKISTGEGTRSCVGTIFGKRYPRIIELEGYRMELKPEGHVVIIVNDDRPGVVGRYGSIFGANDINIADMTFSRKKTDTGMMAVVGINLDQPPTDAIMDEIRAIDFVKEAYCLHLPVLPPEEREE
ncbi:MAG: phosphoglycerate dehydrogenase, partial [Phycisphaerae bacterium]|nr:phosphoglycerate dehydrogenase [Phycisphaerae bacterium]